MHWLITILHIVAVAEASILDDIESFFEIMLGVKDCTVTPEANMTYDTSCGVRPTSCSDSYYRTIDGSCNNLKHGWWGTPNTPYARVMDNTYFDGVHEFPKSKDMTDLPNARLISTKLYTDSTKDDPIWTLGFMQYGQIIAHDMGLAAGTVESAVCCSEGQLTELAKTDPRCAPIHLPKNDPYNGPAGRTCMDFYRTETTKDRKDCTGTTKVAEPLNSVSDILDAGYLYGNDPETADAVREKKGGRLKSVKRHGRQYLPQDSQPTESCNVKKNTDPCYKAGDMRVNQNPQLALLQNVYMIHHNNIADELSKLNPHWDDEKTFQVTRSIVTAVHQYVFYYEMLPYILGSTVIINHNIIYPGAKDFINDYDPKINPALSVEFSTAAFRLYHTFIQGKMNIYNNKTRSVGNIRMRDTMLKPGVIEEGNNFVGLAIGLATQPMDALDALFSEDVLNYMFVEGNLGSDLKTLDIIRGRDHGLATYATAIEKCCLGKKPRNFKDLEKYIDKKHVDILSELYKSPDDVELSVGISVEKRLPLTICGPVSCCLIAEQFYRTRRGDRYFFENNQHKSAFKLEQLNAIRHSSSFAMLLCQVPGVTHIQARAFEQVALINPILPCSYRPKLDLTLWKETEATK